MNIVDLSLKRPIMISMGLLAFVIFGITTYFSMPLTLIPDIKMPNITVRTIYAGASPEVIESQISRKIEDAASSISGVDQVQSYSMDSAALVMVTFDFSKDQNLALQEVKDKVDQILNELPADAEKPIISKMSLASMTPVMNIVLEVDMTSSELYTFAKENVSNKFAQVAGVGSISIAGDAEREIKVNFDSHTVYERNVSILQIAQIIAAANKEIPGGNIQYASRDIPVQMKGTFQSLDDLNNLDIPTTSGVFKLHQLASVDDTSKTVRERTCTITPFIYSSPF
ncbi:MAG: efflux RND transporter permease subunit [Spirochaetaceae bacterium]|nr:efflux RND transporter permease subunit [Spirochaetaceae bacterium]